MTHRFLDKPSVRIGLFVGEVLLKGGLWIAAWWFAVIAQNASGLLMMMAFAIMERHMDDISRKARRITISTTENTEGSAS